MGIRELEKRENSIRNNCIRMSLDDETLNAHSFIGYYYRNNRIRHIHIFAIYDDSFNAHEFILLSKITIQSN